VVHVPEEIAYKKDVVELDVPQAQHLAEAGGGDRLIEPLLRYDCKEKWRSKRAIPLNGLKKVHRV
jgi:hypothetical protein